MTFRRSVATAGLAAGALMALCRQEIDPGLEARWVRIAARESYVREVSGPQSHPRILAYHDTTWLDAPSDETPWCSSFVNWCLREARLRGTDSAMARSWLDWGEELCFPRLGSVVVLAGEDAMGGHVGFLVDWRDGEVLLLGGNQEDAVTIRSYPQGRVLGYRWPSGSAALHF